MDQPEVLSVEVVENHMEEGKKLSTYWGNEELLAFVSESKCNDGMSDNEFEKSVLLFTAGGQFRGCCGQGKPTSAPWF